VEFAVGLSPARQLCAERSFVVSAAHADGGRRRRFILILFSLDLFPPPSSELYSEHPSTLHCCRGSFFQSIGEVHSSFSGSVVRDRVWH